MIFLDYDMPSANGIYVLEHLNDYDGKIIMISNYDHIAFKTYKYNLYWFIRKKYFEADIPDLIENLQFSLAQDLKKFRFILSNKGISLNLTKINFVETEKNYIFVHTDLKTYKLRTSFNSIIKQFEDSFFIIPTYGILVNMNYIEYIDFNKSIVFLKNSKIINISRSKKSEVKRKYVKFNSQ